MWMGPVSDDSPREFAMSLRSGMRVPAFDDRPDVLAGERARQLAALQPVHDLQALDVTGVPPCFEELRIDHRLLGRVLQHPFEGRTPDEFCVGMLLRVARVEPV